MSNPIEDEVRSVRAEVDELARRQQRVAAELSVAEEAEAAALRRLAEEFSVSSVEEAQRLLAEIDADLRARLDEVRAELDKAEGGGS